MANPDRVSVNDPKTLYSGVTAKGKLLCEVIDSSNQQASLLFFCSSLIPLRVAVPIDKIFITNQMVCIQSIDRLTCFPIKSLGNSSMRIEKHYPGMRAVAAGVDHICVHYQDLVDCFGSVTPNATGNSLAYDFGQAKVPENLKGVEWIRVGSTYTCAKTKDGIHCWGAWQELRESYHDEP